MPWVQNLEMRCRQCFMRMGLPVGPMELQPWHGGTKFNKDGGKKKTLGPFTKEAQALIKQKLNHKIQSRMELDSNWN